MSDTLLIEIFFGLFTGGDDFFDASLADVIWDLIFKFSSRYIVVIDMRRKRKGMQTRNLKCFDDIETFSVIFVTFTWKSDDNISPNIENCAIFSFEIS